eukprot:6174239-Pleurochrysis_carterae.AAC.2
MDEKARERATAYMESIGCYLDLRTKGQRNPENTFMTGATVDDYVMGRLRDPKPRSPGLAANTKAMCDLTYRSSGKHGTRRRHAGPWAGFAAGAEVDDTVAADRSGAPEVELAELLELEGSDELSDSAAMHAYLKDRFGERAAKSMY